MVLVGNVSYMLLGFAMNILIIRYITQSEFGLFSLGLAFTNILAVLAGLGFHQGIPSYISHRLGKKEHAKAWGSIVSSFVLTLFFSLFLASLLFFKADLISQVVKKPGLAETIRVLAFTVPLIALIDLLVSYLRAVQDTKGKVYFQYLLRPLTGIVLVLVAIFGGFSFRGVLWAYIISFSITFIFLFLYAKRKIPEFIPTDKYSTVTKEIVLFSLPLLGTGILALILGWTDTFLLGYFETAKVVGLYNGALRVARLIPIISASAGFIYLPVASQLFSQNNIEQIKKIYATVTKWVFIVTLPFFLYVLLAPDLLLGLLFGARYLEARLALQFLALGFLTHVLFGLNAMTSISLGKPKINLFCLGTVLVINVILDILLIPEYGIVGASIASCTSLLLGNVLLTVFIFRLCKIHPFSRSYLRIIAFAIVISVILFLLPVKQYLNHNVSFFLFVLVISLAGIIGTKSITNEDAVVIKSVIKRRITKNARFIHMFDRFIGS